MADDRVLSAPVVAHLPTPPSRWYDVGYSLTAAGKIAIRRCDRDMHAEAMQRRFAPSSSPPPYGAVKSRLSIFDGQTESVAIESSESFGRCDQLSNGCWVVTGYSGGDEWDARILSPRGNLIRRFEIGNAVGHLQCDAAGAIWVGYFDYASGEKFGLIKFDDHGRILWRADSNETDPMDVFHCYALNVSGERAWAYYDLDFPIVDIDANGRTRVRKCSMEGASALAVSGEMAILAGGYEEDRNRIVLLDLDDDLAHVVEQFRLDTVPEFDPSRPWLFEARGEALHMVHKGVWRRLSVTDVHACVQSSSLRRP